MAAARAEAVELETVGLDREAVFRSHFFLKTFDIAVLEFHDFPTTCADEMIVVALVGHIVVLRLGPEMPGLCETCFTKEVQRAINGRQSQVGILPCQLMVHLFGGDVFLFQECVKDQFALAGKFQLMFPKMLLEDSHFFDVFGHGGQAEPPGSELKTKPKSRSRVFL